jgi:starch phosphorylase
MIKPLHSFIVSAKLPEKLAPLKELAMNYWHCWNADAKELFVRINRELWNEVNHNPILMINKISQSELKELESQTDFVSFLEYNHKKFKKYMAEKGWFQSQYPTENVCIAYFSTEYGINESFPNYSGGLGVLSGDHLKSSSDLGLPLVGVGLLYQQGYFRQHLTQHGWQTESYNYNDFYSMPLILMKNEKDEPIIIDVDLPYGKAFAQIWKLNIGKIELLLLDTNIPLNGIDEYRDITDQLYGGTRETRIQQEIMLGIGGMRALKALGYDPKVVHINEGHAAFALMERTKYFMEKYNLDFRSAKQITKMSSIFTTHTPVPAGNETFHLNRMDNYFSKYIETFGISREYFMSLGQIGDYNNDEQFSMTVLGIKMTSFRNGVSKLHGEVARKMWKDIWKCFPENEIPIKHVTNGIHTQTWVAREIADLFDRYLSPRWRTDTDNPEVWAKIEMIPSEELWREKQRRRVRLVLFARDYLQKRQKEFIGLEEVSKINEYFNPDALTIGFARRFATYKRALLLFKDMERLQKIVNNPDRPVQIIIAGKAHPHDTAGKEVIQSIIQRVRQYNLEKKIVFLEDYDLVIARYMVKGCDVWLNNPIRPMEASGTSGMKAGLNGTLNFSVLDGWWDESYNGLNGFAIGSGEESDKYEEQEIIESADLYDTLEKIIVPTFYDRPGFNRIPEKWIHLMKNSIKTIAGEFSTNRMIKDYVNMFYIPALKNYEKFTLENAKNAHSYQNWKEHIRDNWSQVEIIHSGMLSDEEAFVGNTIKVSAELRLGSLSPEDVSVEVFYGSVDAHNALIDTKYKELKLVANENNIYKYEGGYVCPETGKQGFTVRVLPKHELMAYPGELFLCTWAK